MYGIKRLRDVRCTVQTTFGMNTDFEKMSLRGDVAGHCRITSFNGNGWDMIWWYCVVDISFCYHPEIDQCYNHSTAYHQEFISWYVPG